MVRFVLFRGRSRPLPDPRYGDLQPNGASNAIRVVVWALAGLAVLGTLVLGVTAASLPGCTWCHRTPAFVAQTARSAHSKVGCVRCHVESGPVSRLEYAYHLIFGMGLRVAPTSSGPVAGVPDGTCLSCHKAVMNRISTVNGVSFLHSRCAKGRVCTDCHSTTAHGTAVKWASTPQMDQCLDCHSAAKVRGNCTTCHPARSVQDRMRTGEWVVTHGPNWKKTHGMGNWKTCASCHPDDFCVRCHGVPLPHGPDFIRFHPESAQKQRKYCEVCHKQAFCDDCHGMEMPHPAKFTPTHAALVKRQGQKACVRCHVTDDCENCHLAHVHPGGAVLPPGSGKK
jgi:hypothetical protein